MSKHYQLSPPKKEDCGIAANVSAMDSSPVQSTPFIREIGYAKKRRRPPYSYTALIAQAIILSKTRQLTLREIYDSINEMYPQICQGPDIGWQNTIRHNLSLNQCFKRIPRNQLPPSLSSKLRGKGSYWTVDVTLMDPNTRKRLQEAISLGKPAPASAFNQSELHPMQNKKAKRNSGAGVNSSVDAPSMLSQRCFPESSIVYPLSFAPRVYGSSEVNSSSSFTSYNGEDIHYVSPTAQSSSPYFQSTMNSPITSMPNIATKNASHKDFPQGYFVPNNSNDGGDGTNLPPILHTLPSTSPFAFPGNRYSIRTCQTLNSSSSNRNVYSSLYRVGPHTAAYGGIPRAPNNNSPPLLSETNAVPTSRAGGYHPYAYSAAISHTRSTARTAQGSKESATFRYWPTETPGPPSNASTLESRQQSPHSLSPVSSCLPLPDNISPPNTNNEKGAESEKLNIKHLLN